MFDFFSLGLVIDAVVQIVLLVFFLGISLAFLYGVQKVSQFSFKFRLNLLLFSEITNELPTFCHINWFRSDNISFRWIIFTKLDNDFDSCYQNLHFFRGVFTLSAFVLWG